MIEYILFLFIIVLLYLLKSYRAIHKAIDTNNDNKVSEREIYDALQVLEKVLIIFTKRNNRTNALYR